MKKSNHASDYTDSFGLVTAGGVCQGCGMLEVTQDGFDFEILSDYPNPDVDAAGEYGCLVILDEKNLFLVGGQEGFHGSPRAFIYNRDDGNWREVESMQEDRRDHSCGLVKGNSGYEVVVVGGRGKDASGVDTVMKKSFEIFSLETETWMPGTHIRF